MRRAILAVTATVAGLVALLSFKTHSSSERTVASPEPSASLPPGERTAVQGQRLAVLRAGLSQPGYLGSARARDLDEQLAAFGPAELGRLPAQDGVGLGHA